MPDSEYKQEILIELNNMELVVSEVEKIINLQIDFPQDNIYKAALSTYLAQFYNGLENILKRVLKSYGLSLPKTENWHRDLFKLFTSEGSNNLPVLFTGELELTLHSFRKFRHVVFHGYSFMLDWETMHTGALKLRSTFEDIKSTLVKTGLI